MNIGIYMGTFDPPHIGHLHVIADVLNSKKVDFVVVVPTVQNPWKINSTEFEHRYHMLCLATDDNYDCIVSDIECTLKAPYFSYKTLEALKRKFDDLDAGNLYLIVGNDIDISLWRKGDWILNNFGIITYDREVINISSSQIREMIKENKILTPYLTQSVLEYINNNNLYKINN